MIQHLVKCEVCDTTVPFEPLNRTFYPEGWLFVYKDSPQVTEGYHFCSLAHLEQWASKINAPQRVQVDLDDIFVIDVVPSKLSHHDSYVSAHLPWANKHLTVYLGVRDENEAKALAIGLLWQRHSQEIIARIRGER